MRIILVVFLFLMACEESNDLYVANSCTDAELVMIKKGIAKVNKKYWLDIDVIGRRDNDYRHQDSTNSVFCIHDTSYKHESEKGIAFGEMRKDDILVYAHLIKSEDRWLSVFMHELGHYIGLKDIDNNNNVMHWRITKPPVTEY